MLFRSLAAWSLGQGMTVDGMAVATGETYYDALTGAALCGKFGSVLIGELLHDTSSFPNEGIFIFLLFIFQSFRQHGGFI